MAYYITTVLQQLLVTILTIKQLNIIFCFGTMVVNVV